MAAIQGKDVNVEISTDAGTTWKTLICETRNGLQQTRDTTSTSTKCDDGVTYIGLGAKSFNMSFDAVVDTAPTVSQVTYDDMNGWFSAGTALLARIESTGNFTHEGTVYVTDLSLENANGEVSQFSGTLTGSGALTIA
jgi:predicted secreted protein